MAKQMIAHRSRVDESGELCDLLGGHARRRQHQRQSSGGAEARQCICRALMPDEAAIQLTNREMQLIRDAPDSESRISKPPPNHIGCTPSSLTVPTRSLKAGGELPVNINAGYDLHLHVASPPDRQHIVQFGKPKDRSRGASECLLVRVTYS